MPEPDTFRTIHYGGDIDGVRVDQDRTGLPDDCPCTAIRWCRNPPHIPSPKHDCPHHGTAPTPRRRRPSLRLPVPDRSEDLR